MRITSRSAAVVGAVVAAVIATGASVGAQPGDIPTPDGTSTFESGLDGWVPTTAANGTVLQSLSLGWNGSTGLRMTVPDYSAGSIAYVRKALPANSYGVSASGRFKVLAGGCDNSAGYSNGSVPFLRLFDTNGKRVAGLYRINGSCSKTAKVYVQHSGNYYRTGKNLGFNTWVKWELRAQVAVQGASLVQVFMNDGLVFESRTADNGQLPFGSVTMHNEHANQVGDLLADDVTLATFGAAAPPPNPCAPDTTVPDPGLPGTPVLTDGFESHDFTNWTTPTRYGDASVLVTTDKATTGNCSARLQVTANSGSKGNLIKTLPALPREVWMDGQVQVERAGTNSTSNVPFFRLFTGPVTTDLVKNNRLVDLYRVNGTGEAWLRLGNGSGSFTFKKLNRVLALNTWYHLQVHAVSSPTAGSSIVEIWIDGQKVYAGTAESLGGGAFAAAMVGAEDFAQEGTLVIDDVLLSTLP